MPVGRSCHDVHNHQQTFDIKVVQVRSLMKLYVDIEFTDRSNAFYEKFSTRASIGQILEDLWSMPAHRYHAIQLLSSELRTPAQLGFGQVFRNCMTSPVSTGSTHMPFFTLVVHEPDCCVQTTSASQLK